MDDKQKEGLKVYMAKKFQTEYGHVMFGSAEPNFDAIKVEDCAKEFGVDDSPVPENITKQFDSLKKVLTEEAKAKDKIHLPGIGSFVFDREPVKGAFDALVGAIDAEKEQEKEKKWSIGLSFTTESAADSLRQIYNKLELNKDTEQFVAKLTRVLKHQGKEVLAEAALGAEAGAVSGAAGGTPGVASGAVAGVSRGVLNALANAILSAPEGTDPFKQPNVLIRIKDFVAQIVSQKARDRVKNRAAIGKFTEAVTKKTNPSAEASKGH